MIIQLLESQNIISYVLTVVQIRVNNLGISHKIQTLFDKDETSTYGL